jgi:hypothetical protein
MDFHEIQNYLPASRVNPYQILSTLEANTKKKGQTILFMLLQPRCTTPTAARQLV